MKNPFSSFKNLPGNTKALLVFGLVLALVIALPIFIWGITTQRFDIRKKAQIAGSDVLWETAYARFEANQFYIDIVNHDRFLGGGSAVSIHSDRGDETHTTLEASWTENDIEMRLYLYFNSDGQKWWLSKATIYNGETPGDWLTLVDNARMFETDLGVEYSEDSEGGLSLINSETGQLEAMVHFSNLKMQAFRPLGDECVRNYSGFSLIPASQQGYPGSSLTYTVIVKNNDSGLCPDSSYVYNFPNTPDNWGVHAITPGGVDHLITSPGDSIVFRVVVVSPPDAVTNQNIRMIITDNIDVHTTEFDIPFEVILPSTPTPTPTDSPTPTPSGSPTPSPSPSPSPTPTPSPSPTPPSGAEQLMKYRVKLTGVTNGDAEGAKITIRFLTGDNSINLQTNPVSLTHIGGGVYESTIKLTSNFLPSDHTDYAMIIKGEKHLARKFCQQSGQSSPCTGNGQMRVPDPNSHSTYIYDFTGLPLDPGDLYIQDGKADLNDFSKLISLLGKTCSGLSDQEKLTGDLDYSGCVNVRDAFLMRKTLETRYDEN